MNINNNQFKKDEIAIDVKNNIYNTCIELMLNQDFKSINVLTICEVCNISVGGFYNYFNSKEDIVIEAFNQANLELIDIINKETFSGSATDKIKKVTEIYFEYLSTIKCEAISQLYVSQLSDANEFVHETKIPIQNLFTDFIKEGQNNNELTKNYNFEFIANKLMVCIRGIIFEWCAKKGSFDIVFSSKKSITIFLNCFSV